MHYIQFILGMDEILMFECMKHKRLIFRFVIIPLIDWKPFVKIKFEAYISFGVKVWDILFYLLGESNAGASKVFSIYHSSLM